VDIVIDEVNGVFTVTGQDQQAVSDAADAIFATHIEDEKDYPQITIEVKQSLDVFEGLRGELLEMVVIGSKSILTYTVLAERTSDRSFCYLMQVELLGIQTVTTRGNIDSWVNKEEFLDLIKESQVFSGQQVSARGQISCEALGYSQGNSKNNIHALLYVQNGGENFLLNREVLRRGLGKILQKSTFSRYKQREEKVRTFLPYLDNLLSKSRRNEMDDGLSWCKTERELLFAQGEALPNIKKGEKSVEGIISGKGIWKVKEEVDIPSLLPERKVGAQNRRHVYVDNSNIWISGKNLSGERKKLGFDAIKEQSKRIHEELIRGRPWTSHAEKIAHIQSNNKIKKFAGYGAKTTVAPYFHSDRAWRLNYKNLLHLVGWNLDIDKKFTVAGSLPPENEHIWKEIRNLGACNILTRRTIDGVASSEDTSLTTKLLTDMTNFRLGIAKKEDELILFAGDRGFCTTLETVRQTFPTMKIYVAAWASTACYHRLKDMRDENTFFINLDPYINFLSFDCKSTNELKGHDAISKATKENRLLLFPLNKVQNLSRKSDTISDLLFDTFQLKIDRDFVFRTRDPILYVMLTSDCLKKSDFNIEKVGGAIEGLLKAEPKKNITAKAQSRLASRVLSSKVPVGNRYSSLDAIFGDDDDDDEDEDEEEIEDKSVDVVEVWGDEDD